MQVKQVHNSYKLCLLSYTKSFYFIEYLLSRSWWGGNSFVGDLCN